MSKPKVQELKIRENKKGRGKRSPSYGGYGGQRAKWDFRVLSLLPGGLIVMVHS